VDTGGNRVLASTREQLQIDPRKPGVAACYTTVYLDDVLLPPEEQELIRGWDLAVVEYYDGLQVPVRYRTRAYGCGVLPLWSKWY
jgi:hypothetical protein